MRQTVTSVAQSTFNYTCSPITYALHIEWPNDIAPGKITGIKFGQEIHRSIAIFTACIVYAMVVETDN